MVSVTHRFRSTKADAADSSLVKPSDWNDDHDIALTQRAVLGRLAAGPGSATEILLGLDDDDSVPTRADIKIHYGMRSIAEFGVDVSGGSDSADALDAMIALINAGTLTGGIMVPPDAEIVTSRPLVPIQQGGWVIGCVLGNTASFVLQRDDATSYGRIFQIGVAAVSRVSGWGFQNITIDNQNWRTDTGSQWGLEVVYAAQGVLWNVDFNNCGWKHGAGTSNGGKCTWHNVSFTLNKALPQAGLNYAYASGFTVYDGNATAVRRNMCDGNTDVTVSNAGIASTVLVNFMPLLAGWTYKAEFTVAGYSAGSVTPQLTGGSTVSGSAITANGDYEISLVAGAGNNCFSFAASSTAQMQITSLKVSRAGHADFRVMKLGPEIVGGNLDSLDFHGFKCNVPQDTDVPYSLEIDASYDDIGSVLFDTCYFELAVSGAILIHSRNGSTGFVKGLTFKDCRASPQKNRSVSAIHVDNVNSVPIRFEWTGGQINGAKTEPSVLIEAGSVSAPHAISFNGAVCQDRSAALGSAHPFFQIGTGGTQIIDCSLAVDFDNDTLLEYSCMIDAFVEASADIPGLIIRGNKFNKATAAEAIDLAVITTLYTAPENFIIRDNLGPTNHSVTPLEFQRSLREFGARPTNADNVAYIQAAIDWSSVTGGTITDGDPGTYTCLSQINMKDNASLVFGPQTRFEGAFDGDLVGQEDDNVAVENFRILGGEWGKDATSRRRNIFKLNMNRSVISGAVLKTFGKGKAIGFVGDSNLITGCQILDPVNDTGSGGIRCTGGKHNMVSNCYVESGDDLLQLVPSVNGTVNVITAITNANPGVATYSGADTLTNGQTYYITGGKGMTELNGQSVVVANVNTATNTFELQGVNTTSYGVYTGNAIISNSAWDNRDIDDCHFIGCTGVVLYARACNAGLDAREYSGVKIVSISKANPGVVVTDVAHGYTNGQIVRHFDTNGMIELEDVDCTITVVSPTSYSIGVNTTTYGTYTDPANPDDRGYVINYDLTTMSASIRNSSFSHIRVRSEGRISIKSVNFDSLGEINGLTFNDVTVDMRDAPVTYPDGRVNNKSAIYMANQKNLSLRDVRITGTPARLFTISSVDGLRMDNVGSDDVARNLSHTGQVARLFSCKDAVLDRLYIAATPYKNALSIDAGDGDDKDEYDTNDTDPVTNCDIRGLKITGMTDGNTAGGVNSAIVCQDGTDIRINGLDIRKSTDAAYAAYLTNIRAMTVTAPTDAALKSRVVVTGGDVNECSATNKFSLPSAHFCRVKNVRGWVTEANGTGTINNGSTTSGNVSHGLSRTPNAAQIALVITSSSAGTAGPPWIGTVDATKFIASVPTTPTTNMSFSWRIDASEYL